LDRFVENSNLLAQLPPGNEHRPDKLMQRVSASEGAFEKIAAGCCLGRSLVEASASFGAARLYSTVPRAWPP
jgi:hypothetical protein